MAWADLLKDDDASELIRDYFIFKNSTFSRTDIYLDFLI